MIRRIVLENYMSHATTVIEPAEGLTVLVGPNNCGKSAVVSALLTVCGENDGGFMVRHGEKLARVTVETAEGDTIVWQRKRGTPSYVINGREVHRVGRGNLPDDLQTLLKLPVIEFGEGSNRDRFFVHFGQQKEPIFLINSETDVAKFFSSSAEAERLLGMQRRHKKKTQDARGEQRAVEADLTHIAARLDWLAPLDDLGQSVEAIEKEYRALGEGRAAIDDLEGRVRRMESAGTHVARQQGLVESAAALRAPPALDDPLPLERLVERFARNQRETWQLAARGSALGPLYDPPLTEDERGLTQTCARMAALGQLIESGKARVRAVGELREPPVPADLQPLIDLGKALLAKVAAVSRLTAQVQSLATLSEAPALVDLAPMTRAVEDMEKAVAKVGAGEKLTAMLSSDLAEVERKIVAWVTDNPQCPVCGGAVERERLLEAGGPHVG